MVLIVRKMDLSLESTFGLAPGVAAWLIVAAGVAATGSACCPAPGRSRSPSPSALLIGAVNALLIVRFGLNGFIVTLGMLIVLRGLLTGISGGQTFFQLPDVDALPRHHPVARRARLDLDLPGRCSPSAIVVLGFTGFGRSLYAIGGNVDAAKAAGIRTDRVLWIVTHHRQPARRARRAAAVRPAGLGRRRPGQRLHLHRLRRRGHRRRQPQRRQGHACSGPSPASCCST